MAFAEPIAAFFNVDDFAVAALYNGATTVNIIFDAAYIEPLGDLAEGRAPVAWVQSSLIPAVAHGDTFVINAATYKVRGVEPDGTGVVLLRFEEQ